MGERGAKGAVLNLGLGRLRFNELLVPLGKREGVGGKRGPKL